MSMNARASAVTQALIDLPKDDRSEVISFITPNAGPLWSLAVDAEILTPHITPSFARWFCNPTHPDGELVENRTRDGKLYSLTPKLYHRTDCINFESRVKGAFERYYIGDLRRYAVPTPTGARLWDKEYLYRVLQWGFECGLWVPQERGEA